MKNKQIELIAIGYWYNSELPNWPNPKVLINFKWDQKLKSSIISYLNSGFRTSAYLGFSWNRIDGSQNDMDDRLGCCEYTDGIFLWPEGLSFYLKCYDIELPSFFVDNLITNMFKKNEDNIEILSQKVEISFDPLDQDYQKYTVNYDKWLNWWKDYKSKNNI